MLYEHAVASLYEAELPRHIPRAVPVKDAPEAHVPGIPRLRGHRLRHVKRDEPFAALAAVKQRRRPLPLVDVRPRDPPLRQVAVVRLARRPGIEPLPLLRRGREEARVHGDAQQDLVRGEPARQDVLDPLGARRCEVRMVACGAAAAAPVRPQLRVMAAYFGPWPGEVIGHEVEEVEVAAGVGEVDVSQAILAHGQSGGDQVLGRGQRPPDGMEELHKVPSLVVRLWVLPVNWPISFTCQCKYHKLAGLSSRGTAAAAATSVQKRTVYAVEAMPVTELADLVRKRVARLLSRREGRELCACSRAAHGHEGLDVRVLALQLCERG